jgi:hypothetical protein
LLPLLARIVGYPEIDVTEALRRLEHLEVLRARVSVGPISTDSTPVAQVSIAAALISSAETYLVDSVVQKKIVIAHGITDVDSHDLCKPLSVPTQLPIDSIPGFLSGEKRNRSNELRVAKPLAIAAIHTSEASSIGKLPVADNKFILGKRRRDQLVKKDIVKSLTGPINERRAASRSLVDHDEKNISAASATHDTAQKAASRRRSQPQASRIIIRDIFDVF